MTSQKLSDEEWKALIIGIKMDYVRVGKEKSSILKSFEKFVVFQNKYLSLAEICAELHEAIVDSPASRTRPFQGKSKKSLREYEKIMKNAARTATDLYGNCLKLRLLTPIMAEAFLNMVILTFVKDDIRNDTKKYSEFLREKIPQRIEYLSQNCFGFLHSIDQRSDEYLAFKRVMDSRNFFLHGNVDPNREQIETVYFEGTRPLFVENGDHILRFLEQLENLNPPKEVISDYESVHMFLHQILSSLAPAYRRLFEHIINDPYPGYEIHKKRVTKILPSYNATAFIAKMRFDDELKVTR